MTSQLAFDFDVEEERAPVAAPAPSAPRARPAVAAAALDLGDGATRGGPFQMQSWSSRDARWTPMEDGPGASVWRPRPTALDAATKCLTWTGLISIPAMQVVDLATGTVVWRDSSQYPASGAPITPGWDAAARSAAAADLMEGPE